MANTCRLFKRDITNRIFMTSEIKTKAKATF